MAVVRFTLNGHPVSITAESEGTTLLDAIRAQGLTGAKEGCAEGECGACTVMIVGQQHGRTAYRAINSCLMLLPMAADHDIVTVEGLAREGELSHAQRAMAAAGGSQCGYCTPGFVMSLTAEHYRPDRSGPCDVTALAGNLCRCTGYRPIRDAARALGDPPVGPLLARLSSPPPVLRTGSGSGFSRPGSIEECLQVLAESPDATIVAGASDLAVESNLHAKRFQHLVSVEAIDEMRGFSRASDGSLRIGAALTLSELAELWIDAPQAVHDALTLFASPPIRNRATIGGNLATASPIGDMAPLLLALDARLHLAGPADARRTRIIPLSSFFTSYRKTALQPAELLTTIEIPAPLPQHLRFYKVTKRRLDDISTVAAGMAVDLDTSRRIARARFCFGGVAATPVRLADIEQIVAGLPWDTGTVERVQQEIERTLAPLSDHRGSARYRLEVSKSLVERFLVETPR